MEKIAERCPGKREANRQERRAAILAIAKDAFLEQGYSAVTMSGIAAELGGSKGTLWSYFPSKEELFAAVLDEATVEYRARIAGLLNHGDDIATTILQFCRSFIAKITSVDGLRLHRLIAAEGTRFPEIVEIFYSRAPVPTKQMLTGFIAEEMEAGKLRRDNPDQATHLLVSLCHASQHRALLGQNVTEEEKEAEAQFAASIFLRTYAP